jgi:hypothetical protein
VIAIPPQFDEKLKALAAKCTPVDGGFQYEKYLPVRNQRRILWLLKWTRVFAHIWVIGFEDHWRVMYSAQPGGAGPFWGAHYSKHQGHDADSCLLGVWQRVSDEWQPCDSSESTAIREGIENAIDIAYEQLVGK